MINVEEVNEILNWAAKKSANIDALDQLEIMTQLILLSEKIKPIYKKYNKVGNDVTFKFRL